MINYSRLKIYAILLKGDSFGELVFDEEGKINGGKPFVIYSETVKSFINEVNALELDFNEVLLKSKEGEINGEAQKEVVVALLKSIVTSERFSQGIVLERLKDGTIQKLLEKID